MCRKYRLQCMHNAQDNVQNKERVTVRTRKNIMFKQCSNADRPMLFLRKNWEGKIRELPKGFPLDADGTFGAGIAGNSCLGCCWLLWILNTCCQRSKKFVIRDILNHELNYDNADINSNQHFQLIH